MPAHLDAVIDELYGLTPGEFTATRDARAAEARRSGDRELAAAIKQLRRPTTSAWLANRLARQYRDEVGRLLALGAAMRQAQAQVAGEDLRQLSNQRHQVVAALAAQARRSGADAGVAVGEQVVRELEATLNAALASNDDSEALRAGRLTTALQYSGFTPVDPGAPTAAASPQGKRASQSRAPTTRGKRGAQKRAGDLDAADAAVEDARAAATDARNLAAEREQRRDAASSAHQEIRRSITEVERRLDGLRKDEAEAAPKPPRR